MYLYRSDIYYLLTIVMFVVSLICSGVVKSRFSRYAKDRPRNGMTGAMAADRILRANGITDVRIAPIAGSLSDNYDPTKKVLNLSQTVYGESSVSAVAVAAHECGHAIQHAKAYPLLMLRKALVPICNIGSIGSYIAILAGIFLQMSGLIVFGALLFSGIVLFNLVTLPVEFNASSRAMEKLKSLGLLQSEEYSGTQKVLRAAAMTYVAAAAASVMYLIRMLILSGDRRRND